MERALGQADDAFELNLAPIMNLVMILIPLLLLSVVFEQVGILEVRTPTLCGSPGCGGCDGSHTQPLGLALHVSREDIKLTANHWGLARPETIADAIPGCAAVDGTIRCRARIDAPELTGRVRAPVRPGAAGMTEANRANEAALSAYPWWSVYNALALIKLGHLDERAMTLMADPDVPFQVVTAAMDMARTQRESARADGTFDTAAAFQRAPYRASAAPSDWEPFSPLFDVVTFGVVF